MGGFGSGRYLRRRSRSRYFVADRHADRLDVRELLRLGCLVPDARATIRWYRGMAEAASIGTYFDSCQLALQLRYSTGQPPIVVRETVPLTFTACHFGGDRPWFLCPHCRRRCAILWGRERFLCRTCQGVAYASQNESASSRAIRRVHEIRAKLRVDASVPVSSIVWPRYMRFDQYRSLIFELLEHEGRQTACTLALTSS
jgi:hypothetical protein